MFSNGDRFCDLCGGAIGGGITFDALTLAPYEAATLLDVDDPGLVPTWTQLPSGIVRLDVCRLCRSLAEDPPRVMH
jgi:hypothetical protein